MQSKFETPPIVFVLEEKIQQLETELQKSKQREAVLLEIVNMAYDNTKMPHEHKDPQLRLYCLADKAEQALEKYRELERE